MVVAGAAGALLAAAPAAAGAAPPTVIRVGGPSAPDAAKLAVVASGRPLVGKPFIVRNAARRIVLRGRLRRPIGPAAPWRYTAIADVSRLRAPGRYVIRAAGVNSRRWVIDPGARERFIRRLLRIYTANADGTEPSSVFAPAHLKDATVSGGPYDGQHLDLVGGWRDAGDNLKITRTMAYAVAGLNIAARMDPENAALLRRTAGIGVRWILKAHPKPDLFIGLVGDDRDHTAFRDPATDDANTTPGVGVRFAYPTTSADILGLTSAALALAAQPLAEGDPVRQTLLQAATEWFAAAQASGKLVPIAGEFVSDYYPDDNAEEDIAFAALELWRATGDPALLAIARTRLASKAENEFYEGVTSGTIAPLVAAEMCGGFGAPAPDDADARKVGCDGVRTTLDAVRERMAKGGYDAFMNPGIVTFGWSQDLGGASAVAAAGARAGVAADGMAIAASGRDYLLGRNPWGRSFIVGPGAIEAKSPHHAAYLKGRPARLLDGAVVNGVARRTELREQDPPIPLSRTGLRRFNNAKQIYEDVRDDYVTSEVGLTTSISAILMAATLTG